MVGVMARSGLAVLLILSTSGCASLGETARNNPKATRGGVGGAVLGGVIGGLAGGGKYALIGAAAGALIGGVIGSKLDERDQRMAAEAAQQAFEANRSGQSTAWSNPDSGNSGTITPTRTRQLASGQYCREYTQTVIIGAEEHEAYGTACRQPDGSWKIES